MRVRVAAALALAAAPAPAQVVLSEIMYNPPTGSEFIELQSIASPETTDLAGWRLAGGVSFTIPPGHSLGPGGRLVIARSPGQIPGSIGPFSGRLSDRGELLQLLDASGEIIDEVHYADDGPWPSIADGGGPSLELVNPRLPNEHPEAWEPSVNGGTPGAVNVRHLADPIPFVAHLRQSPTVPNATTSAEITARPVCLQGTPQVTLHWRVEGAPVFESIPMAASGEDVTGCLPPQPDGTVVEFHLEVASGAGSRLQPATAPSVNFHVEYDDVVPSASVRLYRLVMTQERWHELRTRDNYSDVLLPATLIAGDDIHHGVGLRYRGSSSRAVSPESFRVNFPDAQMLDGSIRHLNLNGREVLRQYLSLRLFAEAGIDAPLVQFASVVADNEHLGLHVQVEDVDTDYAERTVGDDDAAIFRGEKTAALDWRGSSPLAYQSDYVPQTDGSLHSLLVPLIQAFNLPTDAQFTAELEARLEVDEWLTFFALHTVLGNQEGGIYRDTGDDYFLLRVPSTGRWRILPWDLDSTHINAPEPIFRQNVPAISRFVRQPQWARRYEEILFALLDGVADSRAVAALMEAEVPPEINAGTRTNLTAYHVARERSIRDQLPPRLRLSDATALGPVWALEPSAEVSDIVPRSIPWRFRRGNLSLPADWREVSFVDEHWEAGQLPVGFGDSDDGVHLANMRNNYTTAALRRPFLVAERARIEQMRLVVDYDDGFIAWLNGVEIARANVTGNPGPGGVAGAEHEAGVPETFDVSGHTGLLSDGTNVLALQLFNRSLTDDDATLGAHLVAVRRPPLGLLAGGPGVMTLSGSAPLPASWTVSIGDAGTTAVSGVTGAWSAQVSSETGLNEVELVARGRSGEPIERLTVRWVDAPSVQALSGSLEEDTVIAPSPGVPLRVTADATLPASSTLRLGPGDVIAFDPGVSLLALGRVEITGAPGRPAVLLPAVPNAPWAGVGFAPGSPGGLISHAEILLSGLAPIAGLDLTGAVAARGAPVEIANTAFRHGFAPALVLEDAAAGRLMFSHVRAHPGGVRSEESGLLVDSCTFAQILGPGPVLALQASPQRAVAVRRSTLSGGRGDGIQASGPGAVEITGNTVSGVAGAAMLQLSGVGGVARNVIIGSDIGIQARDFASIHASFNTIAGARIGVSAIEDATLSLDSTVIWDWREIALQVKPSATALVNRSDIEGGSPIHGTGNFDLDPLFLDPARHNYHPGPGSPLIGAGLGGATAGALEPAMSSFDGLYTF